MGETSEKKTNGAKSRGDSKLRGNDALLMGNNSEGGRVLVKDASGRVVWLFHAKIMFSQNSLHTPPTPTTTTTPPAATTTSHLGEVGLMQIDKVIFSQTCCN